MNKNTIEKARLLQEIVKKYYEPGRQDRCKRWIYRNISSKQYPMHESTFFRLLGIDTSSGEMQPPDYGTLQMRLFD
jgi:hypothetical protein